LDLYAISYLKAEKQAFAQIAAKIRKEPITDLLILCCVRSQRGNCCNCKNSAVATRRENQSFEQFAAKEK
jgi:hypothetical protein